MAIKIWQVMLLISQVVFLSATAENSKLENFSLAEKNNEKILINKDTFSTKDTKVLLNKTSLAHKMMSKQLQLGAAGAAHDKAFKNNGDSQKILSNLDKTVKNTTSQLSSKTMKKIYKSVEVSKKIQIKKELSTAECKKARTADNTSSINAALSGAGKSENTAWRENNRENMIENMRDSNNVYNNIHKKIRAKSDKQMRDVGHESSDKNTIKSEEQNNKNEEQNIQNAALNKKLTTKDFETDNGSTKFDKSAKEITEQQMRRHASNQNLFIQKAKLLKYTNDEHAEDSVLQHSNLTKHFSSESVEKAIKYEQSINRRLSEYRERMKSTDGSDIRHTGSKERLVHKNTDKNMKQFKRSNENKTNNFNKKNTKISVNNSEYFTLHSSNDKRNYDVNLKRNIQNVSKNDESTRNADSGKESTSNLIETNINRKILKKPSDKKEGEILKNPSDRKEGDIRILKRNAAIKYDKSTTNARSTKKSISESVSNSKFQTMKNKHEKYGEEITHIDDFISTDKSTITNTRRKAILDYINRDNAMEKRSSENLETNINSLKLRKIKKDNDDAIRKTILADVNTGNAIEKRNKRSSENLENNKNSLRASKSEKDNVDVEENDGFIRKTKSKKEPNDDSPEELDTNEENDGFAKAHNMRNATKSMQTEGTKLNNKVSTANYIENTTRENRADISRSKANNAQSIAKNIQSTIKIIGSTSDNTTVKAGTTNSTASNVNTANKLNFNKINGIKSNHTVNNVNTSKVLNLESQRNLIVVKNSNSTPTASAIAASAPASAAEGDADDIDGFVKAKTTPTAEDSPEETDNNDEDDGFIHKNKTRVATTTTTWPSITTEGKPTDGNTVQQSQNHFWFYFSPLCILIIIILTGLLVYRRNIFGRAVHAFRGGAQDVDYRNLREEADEAAL